ncbi:MAG TPA: hypothetical protein VGQ21_15675 [Thermoanaerobaculia bacterium]|nr:hypothetical protein [Thermoanaerobaculia bacterium]
MIGASVSDTNNDLYAINPFGLDRLIARGAGRFNLFDASPSGAILASREDSRNGIIIRAPGETSERELSWLDGSWVRDISADGRTILFDEEGAGGGSTARVLTRTVDGAPATDLGPGNAVALSPDGKWALARQRFMHPPRLVLIPTGAGQPRVVRTGNIEPAERVAFTPDGRNLVMVGNAPGHPQRTYLCDLTTGQIRPITDERVLGALNDGMSLIAKRKFYPFAGGPPKPIPSLHPDERIHASTASASGPARTPPSFESISPLVSARRSPTTTTAAQNNRSSPVRRGCRPTAAPTPTHTAP